MKDDQIVKILERLDVDPKTDFSFLSCEEELTYAEDAFNLAQASKKKSIAQVLNKSDPNLISILEEML